MLARSPNRKRAIEYLASCGATAITIIDRDGVGVVIIGKTATGIVATRWWIAARDGVRVASAARRLTGVWRNCRPCYGQRSRLTILRSDAVR